MKSFRSDTDHKRADVFLAQKFAGHSRSYFQKLIKDGRVLVNGEKALSSRAVKAGDSFEIDFPEEVTRAFAQDIPLDIVYEDEDLILVNKRAGMVVHPAHGHPDGTLLNAVAGRAGGKYLPLLVHRLDKDTSGIIIFAKNLRAKNSLVKQFENRTVKKAYIAAVRGMVAEKKGRVDAPLGRSPNDRKKIVVGPLSKKAAVTEFVRLFGSKEFSILEVRPLTGRTHQIRSHMSYIGHPVLGDRTYGGPVSVGKLSFERQMLHAFRVSFTHPSRHKQAEYEAPVPADMKILLKNLEK